LRSAGESHSIHKGYMRVQASSELKTEKYHSNCDMGWETSSQSWSERFDAERESTLITSLKLCLFLRWFWLMLRKCLISVYPPSAVLL